MTNERAVERPIYRMPRWAFLLIVGMFVIAIGTSSTAVVAVFANLQKTNDIVEARTAGRIAACNVNRTFAMAHDGLVQRSKDLLSQTFNAPGQPVRTPEKQQQIDAYLKAQFDAYDRNIVPIPKCDPASIAALYAKRSKK